MSDGRANALPCPPLAMPMEYILENLKGKSFKITALTTNRVTGNMRVTDWSKCAEQWSHLRGIAFHQLGSQPSVDLLIGLDSADLHKIS